MVFIAGILLLAYEYSRKDVEPGFWSILILWTPIINIIVAFYIMNQDDLNNLINKLNPLNLNFFKELKRVKYED